METEIEYVNLVYTKAINESIAYNKQYNGTDNPNYAEACETIKSGFARTLIALGLTKKQLKLLEDQLK